VVIYHRYKAFKAATDPDKAPRRAPAPVGEGGADRGSEA
jgi:hypothetical protein